MEFEHYTAKHTVCMNIMHSKTEKFSTQLRHATRGTKIDVTQRSIQISANQAAKLDKFQSQCYSKCSKWLTSTRFHAAMQTFAPLMDSVVDRCRCNPWKRCRLPGNARYVPIDLNKLEKKGKYNIVPW